jgi:hypothetical protein
MFEGRSNKPVVHRVWIIFSKKIKMTRLKFYFIFRTRIVWLPQNIIVFQVHEETHKSACLHTTSLSYEELLLKGPRRNKLTLDPPSGRQRYVGCIQDKFPGLFIKYCGTTNSLFRNNTLIRNIVVIRNKDDPNFPKQPQELQVVVPYIVTGFSLGVRVMLHGEPIFMPYKHRKVLACS